MAENTSPGTVGRVETPEPAVPGPVETHTDTSFVVHVGDATALVEVWADSLIVYGPTTDPRVCHGDEASSHFAAYTVAADGAVEEFGGHLTTVDGKVTRVDVLRDSGRAVARAALDIWMAHPDRAELTAEARRVVLRRRLDELTAEVERCEAEVAAAEARRDEARGDLNVVRTLLLDDMSGRRSLGF